MAHCQYFSLVSLMFLMCVVIMFDRVHNGRLWPKSLLRQDEVDGLLRIWAACNEAD